MAVVITFSGLVGTGKSACARYVSSSLFQQGLPVYYLRFRYITLKSFFEKKRQITKFTFKNKVEKPPQENLILRFENFRLKSNFSFTLFMFYYLWKAYLFYFLIKMRYGKDIIIADRYIYDHLVHYRVNERKQWFIYRLFLKLLPKPDIPFILYSDFDTIMKARPMYDKKYINVNLENYRHLKELCPNTIFLESDQIKEKLDQAVSNVQNYLTQQNYGG